MPKRDVKKELDRKREELRRKGKPDTIGQPRETRRDVVEKGRFARDGTNLDIDEERSEDQKREMERWRRHQQPE